MLRRIRTSALLQWHTRANSNKTMLSKLQSGCDDDSNDDGMRVWLTCRRASPPARLPVCA